MPITNHYDLDIDTTLGGNNASDYVIPSQKAIKDYVDNSTGGNVMWGNIAGNLSNQTDLQDALNGKQATLTAGTGISISSNTISATDPVLINNAAGSSNGVAIKGSGSIQSTQIGALGSASSMSTSVGFSAYATGSQSITIGHGAQATASKSYAFGEQAKSTAIGAFQFGQATNNEAGSVYFGLTTDGSTTTNYKLLGSDGKIPDDRINSTIARASDIPAVNNATLTIQKNGTTVKTFTANASSDVTANITVPTKTSDLTNDDGFITGITSTDVTTALGYTPYNSSNPNGYTSVVESTVSGWGFTKNTGTVTSVNNVSPVNGNVTISIPSTSNLANKDLSNLSSTGEAHFQAPLVSGTNIKTINNNSILGSGNLTLDGLPSQSGQSGKFLTTDGTDASWATVTMPTVDQTYDGTSANAQSGVAIAGAGFLQNEGTGTYSLALLGSASGNRAVGLGRNAAGTGAYSTGIGAAAIAQANYSIQIGYGTNSTASTLSIGFNASSSSNRKNWQLLDGTTGLIPYQRIDSITDNNAGGQLKTWTGTRVQYDAITTKDANTLYNITDDTDVTLSLLELLYPVGAIYIGTCNACPLQALGVGTWQLIASDRVLQGAGTRGSVGSTVNESLPNIRGGWGDQSGGNNAVSKTGAFSGSTGSTYSYGWGTSGGSVCQIDFNASRSSSTYQDNAPVQQDAYLVNIWERTA